jgi:pyridoxamine-phosphate oxidase
MVDLDTTDAWLGRDPLPADPMPLLKQWLDEAFAAGLARNPHAIALATSDANGDPSVRMVLCKAIEPGPGALVFYSHRPSQKGRELEARPRAAAVFYFEAQERQARVTGVVEQVPGADADAYFASRPVDAQIGAWASAQSTALGSRDELLAAMDRVAEELGADWRGGHASRPVPRPPHWVGYRLRAERVELWHGRPGRIHDRAAWRRETAHPAAPWSVGRLAP